MGAVRHHRTQLMVCHQKIAGDPRVHETSNGVAGQYCSLGAYAWCFDHGFYVCRIHLHAKHDGDNTQIEFPSPKLRP